MTHLLPRLALFVLLASLAGTAALAQKAGEPKLYKWVDKNGQVHYGDRIPPEYAEQDRDVLNKFGVPVGREEGTETPAEAAARREREKAERAAAEQAQRDRMLLYTYQSVDDIEMLRARRLDLIDSQIQVRRQLMNNLNDLRAKQVKQAERFRPANPDPEAPAMPENLAADMERTESDLRTQESNLDKMIRERAQVDAQFDADVRRFKELREIHR